MHRGAGARLCGTDAAACTAPHADASWLPLAPNTHTRVIRPPLGQRRRSTMALSGLEPELERAARDEVDAVIVGLVGVACKLDAATARQRPHEGRSGPKAPVLAEALVAIHAKGRVMIRGRASANETAGIHPEGIGERSGVFVRFPHADANEAACGDRQSLEDHVGIWYALQIFRSFEPQYFMYDSARLLDGFRVVEGCNPVENSRISR